MNRTSSKPEYITKTQRAYDEGWKAFAEMKRLVGKGKGHEMLEEIKRQFKVAEKHQFNKLAAEFSNYLQYYYLTLKGDERLGNKYSKLALHYNELCYVENVVTIEFSKMSLQLNKKRAPDEKLIQQLREVCKGLKKYLKYESAQVWICTYSLLNELALFEGNPTTVIKQNYEVIQYLESKGIDRSAHFYRAMTPALIREGRYEEAVTAIEISMKRVNVSSRSWSISVYYRLIIELHRGNYNKAYELFLTAEKKQHINKDMMETWYVVRGYIKFLIQAGKITGSTHFKIFKFLNSIENFSKDKSGQITNVMILKIILSLPSNRNRIIDEREADQKFASRYLEKDSRPRVFFQMLHQIVAGNFQKKQVAAKAAKYVKRLPKQKGYNPDLEIVPYEDLWGMVVEGLD